MLSLLRFNQFSIFINRDTVHVPSSTLNTFRCCSLVRCMELKIEQLYSVTCTDCAMTRTVSRRPFTREGWVRSCVRRLGCIILPLLRSCLHLTVVRSRSARRFVTFKQCRPNAVLGIGELRTDKYTHTNFFK